MSQHINLHKIFLSGHKWQTEISWKKNLRKELSLKASILLHYSSNKIPASSGDFQNRSELDVLCCKPLNTKKIISFFIDIQTLEI